MKYPEHALTGLLPAALGKAGEAQDNARAALRMLIENDHQPLLQEIARRYNQPEVTDAVNAMLALDPLDNHPTKIPTLPAFYQPSIWTRPVLKANAQSLPDSTLLRLGEMLRFPQEEALYPGLLQVKDVCSADSLAGFAWDLFTAWQTAGAPSKESWAFTALGVLGNDDTARKLTPLIRAWLVNPSINAPPLGWIFSLLSVVISPLCSLTASPETEIQSITGAGKRKNCRHCRKSRTHCSGA